MLQNHGVVLAISVALDHRVPTLSVTVYNQSARIPDTLQASALTDRWTLISCRIILRGVPGPAVVGIPYLGSKLTPSILNLF